VKATRAMTEVLREVRAGEGDRISD